MFSREDHTAKAIDNAVSETGKLEKVSASVTQAMTAIFVSFMAADPTLSARAASVIVGDKVPLSKVAGVASKAKSEARTYFSDDANAKALREAIPHPEAMTPDTFHAAVLTYTGLISPRKWIADQKAATDAATQAAKDAANAGRADVETVLDVDAGDNLVILNPGFDPVADAMASALKAIATLVAMDASEGVETALWAIFDAATASVGATVTEQEAIAA